ncbi:polyphosphate kinase 1, partial [bacterium]|nr:polyphosphate kinase 1 [bacterium]
LHAMEELLQTRYRFSRLIRLEVGSQMPQELLRLLVTEMGIDSPGVYVHDEVLALSGLWSVFGLARPDLKDPVWMPISQPDLAEPDHGTILDAIAGGDHLVHMPYDAFGPTIGAFIARAARDPRVVAIKQTLYRTSDPEDPALGGEDSIVKSLMTAAQAGKQVVVLVELKARFDEEANITWARMLEDAGVHVVYGVAGLKTPAKVALVVRREGNRLRRYCHIGTGNYNPKTARLYEDVGIFTANEDLGADLSELFNVLTGYSRQHRYRHLLVAPVTLRDGIVERIRRQAALGTEGRITWKINHVVDPKIIDELYAASDAGVPIDLVIRGVCCLRAGVPGLSENIRIRSIVGEFLEHSRIMRYGSGPDAEYLIGSADMMQRNLNGRVESVTPVLDPRICRRLDEILEVALADDSLAWELRPDGSWRKVPTVTGMNLQQRMKELALTRKKGAEPDPAEAVATDTVIVASGGLVHRLTETGPEILLIHRPRYDDWSFPKGKLHPSESEVDAALREVAEETGFECELGDEIGQIEYDDRFGSRKVVRYWEMEPVRGEFAPNDESDDAQWLSPEAALATLTYDRDKALLRTWLGRVS